MRERDNLEDLVVVERIILKCIFKKLHRVWQWADMFQDRNKWQAFVKKKGNEILGLH